LGGFALKTFFLRPDRRHLAWALFPSPFVEAAVEHGDVLVAKDAEHPPHPARRRGAELAVIDDDLVSVIDTQQTDLLGESSGDGSICGSGFAGSETELMSKCTALGR
jgi:hypothetical protein